MNTEWLQLLKVGKIRDFAKTRPEHHAMLLLISADVLELSERFPSFESMLLYVDGTTLLHLDPKNKKNKSESTHEGEIEDKNGNMTDWSVITEAWASSWHHREKNLSPQGLKNWEQMFEANQVHEISRNRSVMADADVDQQAFQYSLLTLWEETAGVKLIYQLQEFYLRDHVCMNKELTPKIKI